MHSSENHDQSRKRVSRNKYIQVPNGTGSDVRRGEYPLYQGISKLKVHKHGKFWRCYPLSNITACIYINFVARPFHYHFRDKVMQIMREVDPAGVEFRRRRRIKRKVYYSCGPNYTWHVDGYVIDRSL